jgi:hypothetical protein
MNTKSSPQSVLNDIAQIQHMERGTLSVIRHGPDGPYYNHQCYEGGRNVSRYVPSAAVAALLAARMRLPVATMRSSGPTAPPPLLPASTTPSRSAAAAGISSSPVRRASAHNWRRALLHGQVCRIAMPRRISSPSIPWRF